PDFIELMAMRRRTLMKVMEAIVERQRQFFLTEDESELRPMVLKDISAATGLDISVISRAAAGKYAATEGGIYPLKFFFNERVGGGGAESDGDHSQRRIAIEIKRMVEEEDPSAPLTDEAILDRLRHQGFEIARRTVAKYRDRLGIPVARLRKKI
ncbi:MAG: RNA polymerase sigma-54 factor, partial [Duncaniella sp.]|nr:RNA polymerase sigma-54 factor [Duncaniella sp.]